MSRFFAAPKIVTDSKGFGSKTSSDLSIPDRDQYAYVYDLLSEGPIEGLYAGASSIFLNDVPLIDTSAEEIVIARTTTLNTTASSTTVTSSLFDTINNLTYNNVTGMALGKRQIVIEKAGATASDASATKGSNVVTTSSSFFTAANSLRGVNNYITIEGAGDNGTDFRSKILTVTSATEVIIADNIATTVSNVNVHLDFVSTISSISGSGSSAQATLDDAVGVTLTNATCHVGGPVLGSKEMKSLYNFKDLNMVFRTGQRNSAVAPVKGVQGYASTVYSPNLKIDQNDLRQNVSSSIPLNYNLSEIGSGCSQNEGTAPDTVLTASAMGVSIPSETDQIDVTFKIPSSSATKGTGKRWPGFVEFQLFFEYSTDGGSSYPANQRVLAFGPTTDQLLNRPAIDGRRINYWPTKGAIPNNGYIQPPEMTTTPFIEEFKMDVTRFQPFDDYRLRIRRITDNDFAEKPDDKEKRVDRKTDLILQSVENHSTDKLRYPFSALAGLAFNAGAFEGQIPPRSYLLKGRKIKVPTNYRTRDEVGTNEAKYDRNVTTGAAESSYQNWDGKFRGDKTEFGKGSVNYDEVYCNNPVWVYYDILTNERYGMGQFIDASQIDKYELFRLAKYCDELVSDGEGGTEPRFTTNVYLQKTTEATKVLNQLASVFRGMSIWADGQLSAIADMPKESVYTFTKGNVEDGLFQYEGTAERVRTNQIKVFWNDPNDNYRQSTEYVEDFQSIAETGRIIRSEQLAFGCTSRGQAHRLGKWKLLSEQNEKETVSFITSIAASGLRPGNIITVQDADRDRSTYSGRVTNFNPESGLTLDLTAGSGGATTRINGNGDTTGGHPFYTTAQQGAKVVFAGEVNLPSSFSQDACMWEHGGTGVGSWLGVRSISGTYNLTLRSGEGDAAVTATSADGIVTNIPIADIPEFDDQVHTVCWEFAPDATPGTQRLWIDGKLYIDAETTSGTLEGGEWSGGNTGGWLEANSTISGNYSANSWPVTTGSSGLRHYFGELVSSSIYGSSTTEIDLDRTISLPQNYSDNPHQLLLIYPRGGAYLQDETATIDSVTYYKGDLIPSISSSEDAANQDANIFWSENVRVEKQPLDTTVHSSAASISSITVSSAFTTPPDAETVWALQLFNSDGSEKTGTAKEYKVISIKESDDYKIEILAAAYFRNKFEQVERGHVLQARPVKTTPEFEDVIPSPQTVVVTVEPVDTESASSNERGVFTGHKAVISWDFPENSDGSRFDFVAGFEVEHNLKARDSVELVRTGQQSLQVSPIIAGTYEIRVRTISTAGTPSQYFTQAVTITEQQLGIGNVSKVQEIPRGGSLNKGITINKSTGAVSISSPNYTFTSPEGTIHTPSTGSNNNTESFSDLTSGETGYLLFDASETSHQLKAIELVTDTSVSPPVNYAKETSVADGLENATGLVTVTALSNKISGNSTAFSTEYAIGDLVLLQNGSSTTATVNGAVSNSTSVTLSASNSSIKVGQTVTGTGIVNENFVTEISGTSLTLNSPVTISNAITLTFTPQKKYGRVNYIESDTLMFMDRISERPYSGTAIRKQKFKPDFLNDSILATVSYDGTNYSIDENYVSTGETSGVFHHTASNTNSLSDSAFFDQFGRYPLEGDILIVVNTSSTPKSSASYRYEDGAFVSLTNFITGDLIIDGRIKSANHSGTLDGSGFSTAGTSINLPDGSISAKDFRIDSSGNAAFRGDISAASGTLSNSIQIGSGENVFKADSNGIYLGNETFANAEFRVTPAGALTATNATITGAITATSGSFAGSLSSATGTFTGALSGGTISIGSGNNIFKADSNGIYLGNSTFASAPFSVTPGGAVSATNATITGNLTLTNIDGTTVTYTGGQLGVGTIGSSNLGSSAIFPTTLRYERSNSTSAPSDSEFNTAFGRNPRSNDIVVVIRTDTNAQIAYKHNGTSFSAVNNYIDGDLIVDGSITASEIATGTLTSASGVFGSISANDIDTGTLNAANVTISGGDVTINNSGIAINGSSSSINLGSGVFTVSSAGALTATNATITGNITASTGDIGGWTVDANSIFSGTKDVTDYTTTGITISSANNGSIHAKQFYIDTSGNANFKGTIFGGSVRADVTNPIPTDIFTRSSNQSVPTGSENGAFIDLNGGKFVFGDADRFISFTGSELDVKAVLAPTILDLTNTAATTLPSTIKASAVSNGSIGVDALSQAVWNEVNNRVGTGTGGFYATATGNYKGETTKTIVIASTPNHGTETVTLQVVINDSFGAPVSHSYGSQATAIEVTLQYKKATDSTYTTAGSTQTFYANPQPLTYATIYTIDANYSVELTSGTGNDIEDNTDYDFRVIVERADANLSVFLPYSSGGTNGANDSTGTPVVLEVQEGSGATGNITINNNADNRVITGSNTSDTLEAEGLLTFNGTSSYTDLKVRGTDLGGAPGALILESVGSGNAVVSLILEQDGGTTKFTSNGYSTNGAFQFIGDNGTSTTTYGGFDASGNFEIGTTNIIDASRNMSNIESINLNDNKKVVFGTGSDFDAYYNGTNLRVEGTGKFQVGASTGFIIATGYGIGGQTYMEGDYSNGIKLMQGGSTKLQTVSGGVNVTGTLNATGDVVAYYSSDERLKDNITVIDSALNKVTQIRGVEFDWNNKQNTYEGHDIGVIAQEVEKVVPELVKDRDDGYKAVDYQKLTALLIEAVKELKEEVEELKSKLQQ